MSSDLWQYEGPYETLDVISDAISVFEADEAGSRSEYWASNSCALCDAQFKISVNSADPALKNPATVRRSSHTCFDYESFITIIISAGVFNMSIFVFVLVSVKLRHRH